MSEQTALIIVAAILVVLIPIVPKMMLVRIWVLRKLHLNWFANLHENYFDGFVIAVRVILVVLALLLLSHVFWQIP